MQLNLLASLNQDSIREVAFPLREILEGSLYYPCSGIDGTPIRHWMLGVNSFVYADFLISRDAYQAALLQEPVHAYRIVAQRDVTLDELAPRGWSKGAPKEVDQDAYENAIRRATRTNCELFALWSVFERLPYKTEAYGPERFSLLHVRAEGVAAYRALYCANEVLPKVVCFIRPGLAFGGNYRGYEAALASAMLGHPRGLPERFLYSYWGDTPAMEIPFKHWYTRALSSPMTYDGHPEEHVMLFGLGGTGSTQQEML